MERVPSWLSRGPPQTRLYPMATLWRLWQPSWQSASDHLKLHRHPGPSLGEGHTVQSTSPNLNCIRHTQISQALRIMLVILRWHLHITAKSTVSYALRHVAAVRWGWASGKTDCNATSSLGSATPFLRASGFSFLCALVFLFLKWGQASTISYTNFSEDWMR